MIESRICDRIAAITPPPTAPSGESSDTDRNSVNPAIQLSCTTMYTVAITTASRLFPNGTASPVGLVASPAP